VAGITKTATLTMMMMMMMRMMTMMMMMMMMMMTLMTKKVHLPVWQNIFASLLGQEAEIESMIHAQKTRAERAFRIQSAARAISSLRRFSRQQQKWTMLSGKKEKRRQR